MTDAEELATAAQEFHAEHGWIPFASRTPKEIGQKLDRNYSWSSGFDKEKMANYVWQVKAVSSPDEFVRVTSAIFPRYHHKDPVGEGFAFFYRITALD